MTIIDVMLGMEGCHPDRLVPNTIMLCTRTVFIMENKRDIREYEYNMIIASSGCAGIVRA